MNKFHSYVKNFLLTKPRFVKILLVILLDLNLNFLSTWIGVYLVTEKFYSIDQLNIELILIIYISSFYILSIFYYTNQYKSVFRFASLQLSKVSIYNFILYGFLYFITLNVINYYSDNSLPFTLSLIQPVILFFFLLTSRLIIQGVLIDSSGSQIYRKSGLKKIYIYGCGNAGRQLAEYLKETSAIEVLGFFDDDLNLVGGYIAGIKVFSPKLIPEIYSDLGIDEIYLAIPSINQKRRNEIIKLIS